MSEKPLQAAGPYEVGAEGITSITLRDDGRGPMGFYDMIYVYREDGDGEPYAAMPAHNVDHWVFL